MIEISLSRTKDYMPRTTLRLPASKYDMLDACAKLGMEDLSEAKVHTMGSHENPKLNRAIHMAWNNKPCFDELNFLAARLQTLSEQERFLLYGLAKIHEPQTMKDFINMTYNLENVMVAGDIKDEQQLGKFLVKNGFWDFSEKAIPYLDYAKIGADQLDENSCAIADGVYFEDNRDEITEVYDGLTLPKQQEEDRVFRVQIRNPLDADDDLFAELKLPATEEEMTDALEFIGLSLPCEAFMANFGSNIADLTEIVDGETDLEMLNDLADQIDRMSDEEYIKFRAVLEHEDIQAPEKMLACSYQLEQYTFMPGLDDAEEYGRRMIESYDLPEQVKPFVDLSSFGQSLLDEAGLVIGSYGIIKQQAPEQEQVLGSM